MTDEITFKNLLFNLRREYFRKQSLLNSIYHYVNKKNKGIINLSIKENLLDDDFVASIRYKDTPYYKLLAGRLYPTMVEIKKENGQLKSTYPGLEIDNSIRLKSLLDELDNMNISKFIRDFEYNENKPLCIGKKYVLFDTLQAFVNYDPESDTISLDYDDNIDIVRYIFDRTISKSDLPETSSILNHSYDEYKLDIDTSDKLVKIDIDDKRKIIRLRHNI